MINSTSNQLIELDLNCLDFKIFNPLNEKLISSSTFYQIRKYRCGMFDTDKFPKFINSESVLCTPSLHSVCFRFIKMTTDVAEVLIRYFRETGGNMDYIRNINIKSIRFEYEDREREAILSLMSGVLH